VAYTFAAAVTIIPVPAQLVHRTLLPDDRSFTFLVPWHLNAGNDPAALKLGVLLARLERNADPVHYLEQCGNRRHEPERTEVLQLLTTCRSKLAAAIPS
jgi:hypothetical protein